MSIDLFFVSISEQAYIISLTIITLVATFFIVFLTVNRLKNPYPRLSKYIKSSHNKGKELSEIRETLINAGWDGNIIDNELKKYH
ncbi:hypothetical protein KY361_03345 [Candidatus Woesearchaeota archaeon]|nr:hypothetical protein [Candidatus Woesearchaeota archaeon]